MRHLKPGRGPSALTALGGIAGVIFGVFWTITAYSMTRSAPEPFATFFPLFGILFILLGVANVAYNLYNATQKKRLSLFDLSSSQEESDPLHDLIGETTPPDSPSVSIEKKLEELNSLRLKGLITETEYSTQRQRILNSL